MPNTPEFRNTVHPVEGRFAIKVGAVVVKRMEERWFFAYMESLTRPYRGYQVVRGTVEPDESLDAAIIRELEEEYRRPTKILEPLATAFCTDSLRSDTQIYYLAEDLTPATPDLTWDVLDGDHAAQQLVWRFAPLDEDVTFIRHDHRALVLLARQRLLS